MKKWWATGVAALTLLVATGCSSSGAATRTVLVDYNHDQYASLFIAYFPTTVTVRPGDTVHFKQGWTGEPHSVTMGTLVDKTLGVVNPLLEKYPNGQGAPPEVDQQFEDAFKALPFMLGDNDTVVQSAAQPCFLDGGALPQDPAKACPKRAQPDFNGRQAYYNSGFIRYAGNEGNTFNVKLADDIKPGTYGFYCNFHGPSMQGKIVVKPKGAKIPSSSTQDRAGRAAAQKSAAPLLKALRGATRGGFDTLKAAKAAKFDIPPEPLLSKLKGNYFAGFASQEAQDALILEFVPRTINAKVGEKVSWLFVGEHTVSFDVPRYFPILIIAKDGTVRIDHRSEDPIGGPGFPRALPDHPPDPYIVDGGRWGGKGFRSSGLTPDTGDNDEQNLIFSLTFTKPGKYPYACLIHPRMVGTVIVTK
jgi:plastocyanin